MVVVGADVHKSTHTFVAVDEVGRQLGQLKVAATTKGHLKALAWARSQYPGQELVRAVEDCRHLSARLERDLLSAGQHVVRVPPKMMANVRASARTRAKSDRSTHWQWPGPTCVNPTFPWPATTRSHGRLRCSSTAETRWSTPVPARSTRCCGASMRPGQAPAGAAGLAGHPAGHRGRDGPG